MGEGVGFEVDENALMILQSDGGTIKLEKASKRELARQIVVEIARLLKEKVHE